MKTLIETLFSSNNPFASHKHDDMAQAKFLVYASALVVALVVLYLGISEGYSTL